jgi:hypothetical protein
MAEGSHEIQSMSWPRIEPETFQIQVLVFESSCLVLHLNFISNISQAANARKRVVF